MLPYRHEDGTIKFWDASGVSMQLMYTLSTAAMYNVEFHSGEQNSPEVEEEWPPFRKVINLTDFVKKKNQQYHLG